jgi:hypothetical protein
MLCVHTYMVYGKQVSFPRLLFTLHICTYVPMHVCTSVCMHVCMYVRIYVCMHAYMCVRMYECSYVSMYLQTKTGGKRMMRHDRSRGGSIYLLPLLPSHPGPGCFLVSHPCVSFSSLFLLNDIYYILLYIGLLPPCLILDVSVVDWIVNVVRRTLATNHPSPFFFLLPLCDLPFRMLFPLLPAYFKPRAIPLLPSLDFDSMY